MTFGSSFNLRPALWALLFSTGPLFAAEPAAWGIDQLMQDLAQVKTAKGRFVERKTMAMLNAPLESSGTLVYTAPARLEKYTRLPKPETLVLDHDKLSIEYKERGQRRTLALPDYPVIWAFVESIRSTLAGDLATLNRFYRASVAGSEEQWRLSLRPVDAKIEAVVKEIHISGSRSRVRTIEIIETGGDRSLMTITEDAQ
jgi:tRNA A37 threonylcarbamoyladenosine synthetase subunit TsaC/SUA5/YrdC